MDCDAAAFESGCKAAYADLAAGQLTYRWTGSAGHWGHWIVLQLAERFGVEVAEFGICFVTTSSVSFNNGYNSVLTEEIDRRHGVGALQSVFTEAQEQSEARLREAKRSWLQLNNPPNRDSSDDDRIQ